MDFTGLQAGMRRVLGPRAQESLVVNSARHANDVLSQLEAHVVRVVFNHPTEVIGWSYYDVEGKSGTYLGSEFLPDGDVERLSAA